MKELEKIYDPQAAEDNIYAMWQHEGCFDAEVNPQKKPFTIVIPPPNVTGQLHMGHALDVTLQDILIRYKRMAGFEALWMPGTDHAGIATQIKVEENLRKEGKTRHDFGREGFVDLVWEWKREYGGRILNQLKKLGASCDWRRERFTMDEGCSRAVREVFVRLYDKGLIYKGERIINWCPKCVTALSDAEVEYAEQAGHFWHIKYPLKDGGGFLVVATTRPETMLGDTAVAVHPEDERYAGLVGKTLLLPLTGREIPIIADEYVEKDFGTGCVKITPCHDPNDFEVAARHNLPHILILDEHARINENGGKYRGMDRYDARRAVVADLEAEGLLIKVEEHAHNVGACYRCSTTVEPVSSAQWFVRMKPLAGAAVEVVKNGTVRYVPDRFSKIYLNWMENVHDWCISRQLWWGHRIPAFYCDACGEMTVSREDVTRCPKCGGPVRQDEDVLDTWFSSALWPFSTLGWPDRTPELDYFYPTSVLVTGYDIIFFWVARMIFSGMELMGEHPFDKVFIHGIVRDNQGRKMSKSLGNGIDPLEIISAYGADALRFTLVTGISPGNDTRFYTERVEASRNFANKIWNASRFVLLNLDDSVPAGLPETLRPEDRWILTRFTELTAEVTDNLEKFELGMAAQKVYDFIWDIFCDWYIELLKPRLQEGDEAGKTAARQMLVTVLAGTLKLLHPFMPFLSEKIYQSLPHTEGMLMRAAWPVPDPGRIYAEEAENMEKVMAAIRAVRNRRAEMNVPPSKKAHLVIEADNPGSFIGSEAFFTRLASASSVEIVNAPPAGAEGMVTAVTPSARIYIPLAELVDFEKELARLQKELDAASGELARVEAKLGNESFVSRAPEQVVAMERAKREKALSQIEKLQDSIAAIRN